MSGPRIVNIADLSWQRRSRSERITVEFKDPARHLGSTVSGLAARADEGLALAQQQSRSSSPRPGPTRLSGNGKDLNGRFAKLRGTAQGRRQSFTTFWWPFGSRRLTT
jgi:hypothetical protein